MPDHRKSLALLLRQLADLVEQSSTRDVNSLMRGDRELQIIAPDLNDKTTEISWRRNEVGALSIEISEKLNGLATREAGRELLDKELPTKTSLEKFARYLDLPVHRTDKIETLIDRIIESAIGSRLRSEAVQGRKM